MLLPNDQWFSGQSDERPTIVNYDSGVVNLCILLEITNLEFKYK